MIAPPLVTMSRTEAAMRSLTQAAERLRRLEAEEQAAFAEYQAARDACAVEGLVADVELTDGLAASFSLWKQRRAAAEAVALQRADAAGGWHPESLK